VAARLVGSSYRGSELRRARLRRVADDRRIRPQDTARVYVSRLSRSRGGWIRVRGGERQARAEGRSRGAAVFERQRPVMGFRE
jgi:hypothetical protein